MFHSKSFLEVWNLVSTYLCWVWFIAMDVQLQIWTKFIIMFICLQVATSLVSGVCLSEKLWRKMCRPSWNISNSFGVADCNWWSDAWSSSWGRIRQVEPFHSFIFFPGPSEENNCSFFLVLDPEVWTKERKSQGGLFSLQCAAFACMLSLYNGLSGILRGRKTKRRGGTGTPLW